MASLERTSLSELKAELRANGWDIHNAGWRYVHGEVSLDTSIPVGAEVTSCRFLSTDPEFGGTRPFATREGLHPLPHNQCIELRHFRLDEQRRWTELPVA